jgi:hypothetical protein
LTKIQLNTLVDNEGIQEVHAAAAAKVKFEPMTITYFDKSFFSLLIFAIETFSSFLVLIKGKRLIRLHL